MQIRFWGVRGSVASSGGQVARIGGNTSCVEIHHDGHRLIFDAGTGIRALGDSLLRGPGPVNASLLFSHLHWDHVQGFPFFTPAYLPTSTLSLFGPPARHGADLRSVLAAQMSPPSFPVTLESMRAQMRFATATAGAPFELGPFRVVPIDLPHPQGCLGYRVEAGGRSFVYMTDVELSASSISKEILSAIEGADALCLDAQYTPDEYGGSRGPSRRGWGHSTMIDAAQVARAASVGRLFLFHHDPAHNDEQVEAMADEARGHFELCEPAREGAGIGLGEAHCA